MPNTTEKRLSPHGQGLHIRRDFCAMGPGQGQTFDNSWSLTAAAPIHPPPVPSKKLFWLLLEENFKCPQTPEKHQAPKRETLRLRAALLCPNNLISSLKKTRCT